MRKQEREITGGYLVSEALKRRGIEISEAELEAIWDGPAGEVFRELLRREEEARRER